MKYGPYRCWGFVYIVIGALLLSPGVFSQEPNLEKKSVKLFIDCRCERSYIQQEINFVSHVRDQGLSNLNLFIYDIANGSGGRTYKLEFEGKAYFKGAQLEKSYDTNANMTSDEVRRGLVATIKSGLLPYLVESDLADKIQYKIADKNLAQLQDINFEDPWNNWIFEIYGQADINRETSRREFEYQVGFESDHVTEKWRVRTDLLLNQASSEFERNEETFTSERLRYSG
ncbi:MAG: hypothetical protein AAGA86_13610, partial [Bacteroidota bacterium]